MVRLIVALATMTALLAPGGLESPALAQSPPPIEGELNLITPVSKFIHDAALKAFADYAKEKWNVTVKVSAIPAGTPVAYGRITEWKSKPEVDIFWGGESALFEKLAEQKLLQKGGDLEGGVGVHPGLHPQAPADPPPGPGRLLGRHHARAVRDRLQPEAPAAPRGGAPQGLGRPAQSEGAGRDTPVRAHRLLL